MPSSVLGPLLEQHAVLVPIQISDISFILGYLLNFGLLGVLSTQVFIYTTRFRHDPRSLQFTVLLVFFLEVFNSVLVVYSAISGASIRCLSCLITGKRDYIVHGVPISEALPTWAFQALCVLTGLSSSMVQAFFAWRIWILGRSVWIPVAVIVVSLAQCVLLMTGGIMSSTDPNMGVFDTDGAVIWLLISALCDIIITVRTTQLLFQSQDKSNCQATQSLVRKLVKMTIETGLVTVIATFLEFTIAQTLGIAHHGVFYLLSKLYANCLLTTLNARLAIYNDSKGRHDNHGAPAAGVASAIFEPGDTLTSPPDDAFPGPYKTRQVLQTLGQYRYRYHSVGVQSDTVTSGVLSVSESSRPRPSSSCPSGSTFVGTLESERDHIDIGHKGIV